MPTLCPGEGPRPLLARVSPPCRESCDQLNLDIHAGMGCRLRNVAIWREFCCVCLLLCTPFVLSWGTQSLVYFSLVALEWFCQPTLSPLGSFVCRVVCMSGSCPPPKKNPKMNKLMSKKAGLEWCRDGADPFPLLWGGSGLCPSKVLSLFLFYV
jgi:hypothetical protein